MNVNQRIELIRRVTTRLHEANAELQQIAIEGESAVDVNAWRSDLLQLISRIELEGRSLIAGESGDERRSHE